MCAGFTRSEEYVWYYHSGRGTVRLFRRHDAAMVANYALAAEATALVSTSWSLVAGDREGGLTMLAITDPAAGHQSAAQLLASLPSRQRGNTEPVNGGLMRSPLARYCTVLYCTVLYCTVPYCTVLYCRLSAWYTQTLSPAPSTPSSMRQDTTPSSGRLLYCRIRHIVTWIQHDTIRGNQHVPSMSRSCY